MFLSEVPKSLLLAFAIPLGLVFGSFLNVVIYRLPRGENIAYPGSACPGCGAPIPAYHNIPVLSWLVLRGKASCCGARIGARYPLVELLGGLAAFAIVEAVLPRLADDTSVLLGVLVFALHLALSLGLIAAAFIDLEHLFLPDEITLGGAALGLLSTWPRDDVSWTDSLLGAAIGFAIIWVPFDLVYRRLRGRPGMGLGDAKLLLLAGAWFGWPGALFVLFAGATQGTLVTLALLVSQGQLKEPPALAEQREELQRAIDEAEGEEREALLREQAADPLAQEAEAGLGQARIAFGPFLVLACLEYQLFGPWITSTYHAWMMGL
ncbi:MAG: prepilin peptidase [Polyangiaceae bacterium]|nr:prepilin peptidase [Polyangiaceae bacterium]MCW5792381.1 prepilin peptidase [Polyangiaceae bacterium]